MKNPTLRTSLSQGVTPEQPGYLRLNVSPNAQSDTSRSHSYAVVIPAFNEYATIREVTLDALQFVDMVIVIDDGSIDGTATVIEDLPITILSNSFNMGKAASLWRGFQHALDQGMQGVITLDGDGQHSPEDIPRLLARAEENPQALIIGARSGSWNRHTWHRRMANKIADFWVSWASGYGIADSQSGFRVYPSSLLRQANVKHDKTRSFVFESEILIEGSKLGYFSHPVCIESKHRQAMRVSHFRPVLDIVRITKMVAWKLLSRGMYVHGLYHSLRTRSKQVPSQQTIQSSSPPVLPNQ